MNEKITVHIKLDPKLRDIADPDKEACMEFKIKLKKYLDTLIQDLSLPFENTIEITLASPQDELFNLPYLVRVNNLRVRFKLREIFTPEFIFDYAGHIITGIIIDRKSLLTRSLSDKIFKNWMKTHAKFLNKLTNVEFYDALIFCIENGLSIYYFYELMSKEEDENLVKPLRFYERFLMKNTTSLDIFLNRRLFKEFTTETTKDKLKIDQSFESLIKMLPLMQDGMFYELGVIYPEPKISFDKNLSDNQMAFKLNDIHFPPVRALRDNEHIVNETAERLHLLKINGKIMLNPANRSECAVVTGKDDLDLCKKSGLTSWDSKSFLILYISSLMRNNASMFLSVDIIKELMYNLNKVFPALYESALLYYSFIDLACILRYYLRDELSLRNLREILENLIEIRAIKKFFKDNYPRFIEETVRELRITQKQFISYKYAKSGNILPVIILDSDFEDYIEKIIDCTEIERITIVNSIYTDIRNWNFNQFPVILIQSELRQKLQDILRIELPDIKIIAYEELDGEIDALPIKKMKLNEKSK